MKRELQIIISASAAAVLPFSALAQEQPNPPRNGPDYRMPHTQRAVGLEFRLSNTLGLFSDARYVWPQHSSDALRLHAGLRIVF